MKVAILASAGRLEVLEKPQPKPTATEALLKVEHVGICGTDRLIFQGGLAQRARPGRILGHEMVGVIVKATPDGKFQAGQRVVVEPTVACGECAACRRGLPHVCLQLKFLGIDADGALQQWWAVPTDRLHQVPAQLLPEHAALVEPLAVAVHAVRRAALQPGEQVAVIGGGPIGLLIALLAQRSGALVQVWEITPHRLAFARQLGLTASQPQANGPEADVVFEASGSADGVRLLTALAAVAARLIVVGIQGREVSLDLYQVFHRELTIRGTRAYSSQDFREALRLIADGEINVGSFISHHFALCDVQAALELAGSGAPTLKIMIDLD
jgi:2-desacetyl-2-hydroxyethyl bacteriochlorophyllide A dehydrogenase